jgi:chaperonin GroEL
MPYLRLVRGEIEELEITEGMKLERFYLTLFHYEYRKMEVSYDNPYILLRITLVQQDLLPILEQITKTKRPLLIIAEDVSKH